jgi:hypothetical protein
MRRFGLAIVAVAAIPAVAVPLLACIAAISAPAALVAAVAAIAIPVQDQHADRRTVISQREVGAGTGVGNYAQR